MPPLTIETLLSVCITMLLAVTVYFLKQTVESIGKIQQQQIDLAERISTLEGRCEATHKYHQS